MLPPGGIFLAQLASRGGSSVEDRMICWTEGGLGRSGHVEAQKRVKYYRAEARRVECDLPHTIGHPTKNILILYEIWRTAVFLPFLRL